MCSLSLFHVSYYDWGKENRSLFRGLRYIEVRYIEVPLWLIVFLSDIKKQSQRSGGVGVGVGEGDGVSRNCHRKHSCVMVNLLKCTYWLSMALVRISCWAVERKQFYCLMKYLQYNGDKYCTDSI